jgi:hypothetical protein
LLDIILGPGNLDFFATQASTAISTTKLESVVTVIAILNFTAFVLKIYRIGNLHSHHLLDSSRPKAGLSRYRGTLKVPTVRVLDTHAGISPTVVNCHESSAQPQL